MIFHNFHLSLLYKVAHIIVFRSPEMPTSKPLVNIYKSNASVSNTLARNKFGGSFCIVLSDAHFCESLVIH